MEPVYREFAPRFRLIFRAWRYRLRTDPAEIAFLRSRIRPGQTAIDAGAHKGAYTYWMHARVGPSGRVFAFEPLPHLAAYLRHVQRVFPLRRLTVVEAALADGIGEASLFMPERGYQGPTTLHPQSDGHVAFRVKTDTLTAFCDRNGARPVHFIKADVEGYEWEVFRGGERVLREDMPILLFECADFLRGGGRIDRVFPYLESLGYEGYFFPGGRMEPVRNFRVDKHQKEPGPDWCMNFGFVPRRHVRRRTNP